MCKKKLDKVVPWEELSTFRISIGQSMFKSLLNSNTKRNDSKAFVEKFKGTIFNPNKKTEEESESLKSVIKKFKHF